MTHGYGNGLANSRIARRHVSVFVFGLTNLFPNLALQPGYVKAGHFTLLYLLEVRDDY